MAEESPLLSNPGSPSPTLLRTKLFAPSPRPGLVARPRLMEHLNQGPSARLVLVSGPAGFGKTTLLAAWPTQCGRPVAWLSLDASDNDPVRFAGYLVAALQTAFPEAGKSARGLLLSPQPPAMDSVLTLLANDLCSLSEDLVLVLDDYHAIASLEVHGAVGFMLDRFPPHVHLAIATRVDPPLPLARLRSQGRMVEIRAGELRFTREEAAEFLNRVMGFSLSAEEVAALETRTEGWIAGLQLAALSMRDRQDVSAFVQAFTGSHRFVLDYLVEEVLEREPEDVQKFLLRTSVLERLSGPLCDAVMGGSGGQAMLERLERANLFVVPLDDERRWYRYHQLFADLLRARLRAFRRDLVPELLVRAAEWCEGNGLPEEAVDYALASGDYGWAVRLMERLAEQVGSSGQLATLTRWLEALPDEVLRESPTLSTAYCYALWLSARLEELESRLEELGRALAQPARPEVSSTDAPEHAALAAQVAALRANLARNRGDLSAAVALAEQALALAPAGDLAVRLVALYSLATAYHGVGDLARAVPAYAEVIRLARVTGKAIAATGTAFHLVRVLQAQGRLREAGESCEENLRFAEQHGWMDLPATGLLHVALADLQRERNELEGAERHALRGKELGRRGGFHDALKYGSIVMARLKLARGEPREALVALDQVEDSVRRVDPRLASAEVATYLARARTELGDLAEALRWTQEAARRADVDRHYTREMVDLASARLLIAQGRPNQALEQVGMALEAARASSQRGLEIEALVVGAVALQSQQKAELALAELGRALALAAPEGHIRTFLDEGPVMIELLRRGVERRCWDTSELLEYARRLLAAHQRYSAECGVRSAEDQVSPLRTPHSALRTTPVPLVEPLSERELEVLRLLARGLSNRKIAEKLVVTVGTIKAHLHNVYGKLGVEGRVQAISRARELDLLQP